jgi:prophage regulatory protein
MFNPKGNNVTQANPSKTAQPERLLRLPDVENLVGLRKSSIYDAMKRGEFPVPVKLSRRAVCWPASAIDAWIAERIKTGGK